jgi:hypothetical protein
VSNAGALVFLGRLDPVDVLDDAPDLARRSKRSPFPGFAKALDHCFNRCLDVNANLLVKPIQAITNVQGDWSLTIAKK